MANAALAESSGRRAAVPRFGHRMRSNWLLMLPALLLLLAFLIVIANLLRWSFFEQAGSAQVKPALTLANYRKVFDDWLYLGTLLVTLKIALLTAIANTLLGLPLAYWIVRTSRRQLRTLLITLVAVPFFVSHIVKLYSALLVLGNAGLINWTLQLVGVLPKGEYIRLIRNEFAVIAGLTAYVLPFMVFTLAVVFRRFDRKLEEAAQNLGASEVVTFFRITLPITLPGIFSAMVLAFVLSATAVSAPLIMGGGAVHMITNMIYDRAMHALDTPLAAALAVVALVTTVAVLTLGNLAEARLFKRRAHAAK